MMFSLMLFHALVFESFLGFLVPAVPTMSAASPTLLLTAWLLEVRGLFCTNLLGNRVGFHLPPLLVVYFPFWVTRHPARRGCW
jgi:hypothetical protein